MRANRRRVGLSLVVLVALCLPLSAWSAVISARGAPALRSAVPSTGTVVTVLLPPGACSSRRMSAVVTVKDGQRRPLARVRVSMGAGTWIGPAAGVTGATGKVTLQIRPVPFRRGPYVLKTTATPTDRAAVTKRLTVS